MKAVAIPMDHKIFKHMFGLTFELREGRSASLHVGQELHEFVSLLPFSFKQYYLLRQGKRVILFQDRESFIFTSST
jgi:hypothetical protein